MKFSSSSTPWRGPPSSVKVKVLPRPGSVLTVMSPPRSRASRRLIVRPSPVPPNLRVVEASACVNGWNSLAHLLGGHADPGVADVEADRVPEVGDLPRDRDADGACRG